MSSQASCRPKRRRVSGGSNCLSSYRRTVPTCEFGPWIHGLRTEVPEDLLPTSVVAGMCLSPGVGDGDVASQECKGQREGSERLFVTWTSRSYGLPGRGCVFLALSSRSGLVASRLPDGKRHLLRAATIVTPAWLPPSDRACPDGVMACRSARSHHANACADRLHHRISSSPL